MNDYKFISTSIRLVRTQLANWALALSLVANIQLNWTELSAIFGKVCRSVRFSGGKQVKIAWAIIQLLRFENFYWLWSAHCERCIALSSAMRRFLEGALVIKPPVCLFVCLLVSSRFDSLKQHSNSNNLFNWRPFILSCFPLRCHVTYSYNYSNAKGNGNGNNSLRFTKLLRCFYNSARAKLLASPLTQLTQLTTESLCIRVEVSGGENDSEGWNLRLPCSLGPASAELCWILGNLL